MLILDSLAPVTRGRIHVPYYHRGHLSLKSGTRLHVCLMPVTDSTPSSLMTEMVISPVRFESWPHLWRITASFRERPGVIHELLTVVRAANFNVVLQESSSVENRDIHEIELIVDATPAELDERSLLLDDGALQSFEKRATALCIRELAFERGCPRLHVQRMKGLRGAYLRAVNQNVDADAQARPLRGQADMRKGWLQLSAEMARALTDRRYSRALLVSDTNERLLRVFFPRPDQHFTYVRVAHADEVGAVARITGALANAFDVVTSLLRIQAHGGQNHLELLLYSANLPKSEDEDARRDLIGGLFSGREFADLGIRLDYPLTAASAGAAGHRPRKLPSGPVTKPMMPPELDAQSARLPMAEILRMRIEELESRLPKSDEETRLTDAQLRTLNHFARTEPLRDMPLRIFVSYDTGKNELYEIACTLLTAKGCTPISGNKPSQSSIFRDDITERIRFADGFLGIWTPRSGVLSMWLPVELGVALACRRPYRKLYLDGMPKDLWGAVDPELQHFKFTEARFEAVAKDAIDALLADIHRGRARPMP